MNKLEHATTNVQFQNGVGRREITFTTTGRSSSSKNAMDRERARYQSELKKHKEERRQVIRSAKGVIKKTIFKKL